MLHAARNGEKAEERGLISVHNKTTINITILYCKYRALYGGENIFLIILAAQLPVFPTFL
jgi:hypothetical protein